MKLPAAGLDYAWAHPPFAAIEAGGWKFACRYLSNDRAKNLSSAEASGLLAHGIAIVVVWETTAQRALSGLAGGRADAATANRQAQALGLSGIPIYFACDWDANLGQQPLINSYLDGAAAVIGRNRVGLYGGYWPLYRASRSGKAHYFWQTVAWSGSNYVGHQHDLAGFRRDIMQWAATVRVGGVTCDRDTAYTPDFGQWPRPGTAEPPPPVVHPVLRPGATGRAVRTLQARLNAWGAKLAVDGGFGKLTLAAVKHFQWAHGLAADGIVGPLTWAALLKAPTP